MEPTKLLYLQDMQQLTCQAVVEAVEQNDGRTVVYLDGTVFYPQGGGQPYDKGTISSQSAKFVVEEVRFEDGVVHHIGHYENGQFMVGEEVDCQVDAQRRALHTRLHSGGHIVDMAVGQLGYDWTPTKGHHFPDGPYAEYSGDLGEVDKDTLMRDLNQKIADILDQDIKTDIRFVDRDEMTKLCRHVPEFLPKGKPGRVVMYGDFGMPCGGTHVTQLRDIGKETIRKIKTKPGSIKISYQIEELR